MSRQLLLEVDFKKELTEGTEKVVKQALNEPVEKVLQVEVKVYKLLKAQYFGMSISRQAKYAGIDPSNYVKILKRGREYAESDKPGHEDRAARFFYEAWLQIGMEAAFDDYQAIKKSDDWKARKYLLECRFPEVFRQEKKETIKQDNRVQIAVDVQSMDAKQLLEMIRERSSRLEPAVFEEVKKVLPEETAQALFTDNVQEAELVKAHE